MRTLPALTAVALGASALIAGSSGVGTAAPSGCSPSWHIVRTPLTGSSLDGEMVSVDSLSTSDTRVGGTTVDEIVGGLTNTARSWRPDGDRVREPYPIPQNLAGGVAQFTTTASSYDSAADGWQLTGMSEFLLEGQLTTQFNNAERWHDGRWTATPTDVSPRPAQAPNVEVDGITAISPDDAWLVGDIGSFTSPVSLGALTQHWNGTDWVDVANPYDHDPGYLLAVRAVSTDDVWAVGERFDDSGLLVPLIEHWDGSAWADVPGAETSGASKLTALYTRGADDVYAVGGQSDPATGAAVPLVEHWDGSSWSQAADVPGIGALPDGEILTGVYAAGDSDVWATAQVGGPGSGDVDNFLHFDGDSWTIVQVPGIQEFGQNTQYVAIDGTGPDDVWAAGSIADLGTNTLSPRLAHLSCG